MRTWGRSFARLAEWQVGLLTRIAVDGDDPAVDHRRPRREGAAERRAAPVVRLAPPPGRRGRPPARAGRRHPRPPRRSGSSTSSGFTGRSRQLTEGELVAWVERLRGPAHPQHRRGRRPHHQDDRRRGALRHRLPRGGRRGRAGRVPSAARTLTTTSHRCARASPTARSSAGSATCSARPSTSPPGSPPWPAPAPSWSTAGAHDALRPAESETDHAERVDGRGRRARRTPTAAASACAACRARR